MLFCHSAYAIPCPFDRGTDLFAVLRYHALLFFLPIGRIFDSI